MKKAIIGKKLGMTQVFEEGGTVVPVSVIQAGPCVVIQKKTADKDGYNGVVVGFGAVKEKRLNKPELGVFKKAKLEPKKYLREIAVENFENAQVGTEIKCTVFKAGDIVDVTGISKGHGYSGVIKRHGFRRNRMSHGAGPIHREVGSLGASSSYSKVFKGRPMPGQMGRDRVTIQNLKIIKVDEARNVILVKGAIPGAKEGLVEIRSAAKGVK